MIGAKREFLECANCGASNLPKCRCCYNCEELLEPGLQAASRYTGRNRRKFERQKLTRSLDVRVDAELECIAGKLLDFSIGGCRFACDCDLEVGTQVHLEIDGGGRGKSADVIIRSSIQRVEGETVHWEIGCEFLSSTPILPFISEENLDRTTWINPFADFE